MKNKLICTQCGSEYNKEDLFCGECGNKIEPQKLTGTKRKKKTKPFLIAAFGVVLLIAGYFMYPYIKDRISLLYPEDITIDSTSLESGHVEDTSEKKYGNMLDEIQIQSSEEKVTKPPKRTADQQRNVRTEEEIETIGDEIINILDELEENESTDEDVISKLEKLQSIEESIIEEDPEQTTLKQPSVETELLKLREIDPYSLSIEEAQSLLNSIGEYRGELSNEDLNKIGELSLRLAIESEEIDIADIERLDIEEIFVDEEGKVHHQHKLESDKLPQFRDCLNPICSKYQLNDFIEQNLIYPEKARIRNLEGTVLVEFTVGIDGYISGERVIQGIGGGCKEAALDVIRLFNSGQPMWKPAEKDGAQVSFKYMLPVKFEL